MFGAGVSIPTVSLQPKEWFLDRSSSDTEICHLGLKQ